VQTGFAHRCASLSDAWQWWAQHLTDLDKHAWQTDTRLEGWDVAALAAHHSLLVRGLALLASQPVDAVPDTSTAADMLRRFNAVDGIANTGAGMVAEMARQQAASMSTTELASVFAESAPRTIESLRTAGPIVVEYFGNGTFPLAEAITIATVEAVVHALDLADAVGADKATLPAGAVRATVDLLASLADPVRFVEAATGRTNSVVLPVLR
jgi:uncharacterized protein (TIGR03083 family)